MTFCQAVPGGIAFAQWYGIVVNVGMHIPTA